MSAESKDCTIAGLVRQIDDMHAEVERLTSDLAKARAERDTANGKVFQYERRGW